MNCLFVDCLFCLVEFSEGQETGAIVEFSEGQETGAIVPAPENARKKI
jgi:hypothetical protein